jgi:hypothetical protein
MVLPFPADAVNFLSFGAVQTTIGWRRHYSSDFSAAIGGTHVRKSA